MRENEWSNIEYPTLPTVDEPASLYLALKI